MLQFTFLKCLHLFILTRVILKKFPISFWWFYYKNNSNTFITPNKIKVLTYLVGSYDVNHVTSNK